MFTGKWFTGTLKHVNDLIARKQNESLRISLYMFECISLLICTIFEAPYTKCENIRNKIKEHLYSSDYSVMENQSP